LSFFFAIVVIFKAQPRHTAVSRQDLGCGLARKDGNGRFKGGLNRWVTCLEEHHGFWVLTIGATVSTAEVAGVVKRG
jgi:hypothetical protein